jgi:hypothetical protein
MFHLLLVDFLFGPLEGGGVLIPAGDQPPIKTTLRSANHLGAQPFVRGHSKPATKGRN